MFYRKIIEELHNWAQQANRNSLFLRGARQVGKTLIESIIKMIVFLTDDESIRVNIISETTGITSFDYRKASISFKKIRDYSFQWGDQKRRIFCNQRI